MLDEAAVGPPAPPLVRNTQRWLSADGSWPAANDEESDDASPSELAVLAADRRATRLAVLRARRAARIAALVAGRASADGAIPALPGLSDGPPRANSGASGPGPGTAGPGIWGRPSDWPASPESQRPAPRRPRARAPPAVVRGVRDGVGANLRDAAEIIKAEWDEVEPSTIAHCWVKSTILPSALTMDLTAVHGEYRLQSASIHTDIDSVVTRMAGCRFGERAFAGTPVWEMGPEFGTTPLEIRVKWT